MVWLCFCFVKLRTEGSALKTGTRDAPVDSVADKVKFNQYITFCVRKTLLSRISVSRFWLYFFFFLMCRSYHTFILRFSVCFPSFFFSVVVVLLPLCVCLLAHFSHTLTLSWLRTFSVWTRLPFEKCAHCWWVNNMYTLLAPWFFWLSLLYYYCRPLIELTSYPYTLAVILVVFLNLLFFTHKWNIQLLWSVVLSCGISIIF